MSVEGISKVRRSVHIVRRRTLLKYVEILKSALATIVKVHISVKLFFYVLSNITQKCKISRRWTTIWSFSTYFMIKHPSVWNTSTGTYLCTFISLIRTYYNCRLRAFRSYLRVDSTFLYVLLSTLTLLFYVNLIHIYVIVYVHFINLLRAMG